MYFAVFQGDKGLVVSIEEYFNFAIDLKKNYIRQQARQKAKESFRARESSSSPH